jgi:hypothetical protein
LQNWETTSDSVIFDGKVHMDWESETVDMQYDVMRIESDRTVELDPLLSFLHWGVDDPL